MSKEHQTMMEFRETPGPERVACSGCASGLAVILQRVSVEHGLGVTVGMLITQAVAGAAHELSRGRGVPDELLAEITYELQDALIDRVRDLCENDARVNVERN